MYVPVEHADPEGEMEVYRVRRVCTEAYIGRVEEFVMDPDRDNITHLVVREGHMWDDALLPSESHRSPPSRTAPCAQVDKEAVANCPSAVSRSK
jgi:sporulation protein YlmC with PRC-barrel domain